MYTCLFNRQFGGYLAIQLLLPSRAMHFLLLLQLLSRTLINICLQGSHSGLQKVWCDDMFRIENERCVCIRTLFARSWRSWILQTTNTNALESCIIRIIKYERYMLLNKAVKSAKVAVASWLYFYRNIRPALIVKIILNCRDQRFEFAFGNSTAV